MKRMSFTKRIPVLVVEEDGDLRELIRYSLYPAGFEVFTAQDCPSGIETASEHKPRLILLDVKNKFEALSTLRYDSNTRNIPIILLVESRRIEDMERLFEAGADDYITKPFDNKTLGKSLKEKLKKCEKVKKKAQRQKAIPVLVVEEDDDLRESIRDNLCSAGFEVYTAADGPSGIEAVSKYKLRLILLDVENELEVLSTLKYDSNARGIPVIVLTDSSRIEDIERIHEAGADDYITKPLEDKHLGKIVKEKLKKCEDIQKKKQRLKRIPVLVIDDEAGLRKSVEYNLHLDGFEVHTAEDGPSGIKAALKLKPDVILLDVMMPGMDGLHVLSTLKRNPRTSHIPVIMLTAKNLIQDVSRAFALGADDYITKPFEGKKLGKTIKEKLEKRKK